MDDLVFHMVKWFLGSDMRYSVTNVTDALYFIYLFIIIIIFFFLYFYHSDILNTYVKCALIMHISLSLYLFININIYTCI